jgi:hypothetical protein
MSASGRGNDCWESLAHPASIRYVSKLRANEVSPHSTLVRVQTVATQVGGCRCAYEDVVVGIGANFNHNVARAGLEYFVSS